MLSSLFSTSFAEYTYACVCVFAFLRVLFDAAISRVPIIELLVYLLRFMFSLRLRGYIVFGFVLPSKSFSYGFRMFAKMLYFSDTCVKVVVSLFLMNIRCKMSIGLDLYLILLKNYTFNLFNF